MEGIDRKGQILVIVPEEIYSDPGWSLREYRRQAQNRAALLGGELVKGLPEIVRNEAHRMELDGETIDVPATVYLFFRMVEVNRGGH